MKSSQTLVDPDYTFGVAWSEEADRWVGTCSEFPNENDMWAAEEERILRSLDALLNSVAAGGYRRDADVRKAIETIEETSARLETDVVDQYREYAQFAVREFLYDRAVNAGGDIRRLIADASPDLGPVFMHAHLVPGEDVIIDGDRGVIVSNTGVAMLEKWAQAAAVGRHAPDRRSDSCSETRT